jgi:hypothetical protein
MALGRRPHERRLPAPVLARIEGRSMREEHSGCLHAARSCDRHERGLAFAGRRVGVGAGGEQALDRRGAAVLAREVERRHAVAVRRRDVGAGPDQPIGQVQIVAPHGPVESRRPIRLRRVDAGVLAQQRQGLCPIARLDGFDEPAVGSHRRLLRVERES